MLARPPIPKAPILLHRSTRPISKIVFTSWSAGLKSFSCFTSESEASSSGFSLPSGGDISASVRIAHSSAVPCGPQPIGISASGRDRLKKHNKPPACLLERRLFLHLKHLSDTAGEPREYARILKRIPNP